MFIAFDLDGTLADPSEGATRGFNHTLAKLGLPTRQKTDLLKYIGPPTEWIFSDLLGTKDPDQVENARRIFSHFFHAEGFALNHLYAKSESMLETLHRQGHHLTIVTSKSDSGAQAVARLFNLFRFVETVHGRVNDSSKIESLQMALGTTKQQPCVMVGDRHFDVDAARACGCISIGVTWGFGTVRELKAAGADYLVSTREDLVQCLERLAARTDDHSS